MSENKEETLAVFYKLLQEGKLTEDDIMGLMRGIVSVNPELAQRAVEVSDAQLKQTSTLLEEAKKESGASSIVKVDQCLESLSRRYSMLLAQIGSVEAQLELCEMIRTKAEQSDFQTFFGTTPLVLMVEFVNTLKSSIWASITWENIQEKEDKKISEYARLVTMLVEPNKAWDGKINFTFRLEGYVTEQDFLKICQRLQRGYAYYTQ